MYLKIFFIFTIIFFSIIRMYASDSNLLLNPGFEQGNVGFPDKWEKNYWDQNEGAAVYSLVSEGVHSGRMCLRISCGKSNDARVFQSVKLAKGNYRFSAFIKVENVGNEGRGGVISVLNQFSPLSDGKHGTSAGWEEIAFYITNESEKGEQRLSLGIGDYSAISSGTVYFDDASLIEVAKIPDGAASVALKALAAAEIAESINFIQNPGFEQGAGILPDAWAMNLWDMKPGAGEIFWLRGEAHSGNRSIQINNNKENDSRLTQPFVFLKGKKYKFSAWMKSKNLGHAGKGAVLSIMSRISPISPVTGDDPDWKEISIYFQADEKKDSEQTISVGLGDFSSINTGTVWFDDLSLVEVGEFPPQADVISIVEKAPEKSDSLIPFIMVILGILALTMFVGVVLKIKTSGKQNAAGANVPGKPQNHNIEQDHTDDHVRGDDQSDDRSPQDSAEHKKADE